MIGPDKRGYRNVENTSFFLLFIGSSSNLYFALIVRLFRSSLVAVPVVVSFFGAATGAAVSVFESSAIAVGTPRLPVPLPFTVNAT